MLVVRGYLASVWSRQVTKDGKSYTFWSGAFVGPKGGRPVEVNLGDAPLEINCEYELEVYVSCFGFKSGGFGYQLNRPKNGHLRQLKPSQANAA